MDIVKDTYTFAVQIMERAEEAATEGGCPGTVLAAVVPGVVEGQPTCIAGFLPPRRFNERAKGDWRYRAEAALAACYAVKHDAMAQGAEVLL